MIQQLLEDEFDRRMEFYESIMERYNRNEEFVANLIFLREDFNAQLGICKSKYLGRNYKRSHPQYHNFLKKT